MLRDHGFYWVEHPDHPQFKLVAKWCHLQAADRHVWLLPGDENYRFDDAVTVVSARLSEPGASILSRLREWLGIRDKRRNVFWH